MVYRHDSFRLQWDCSGFRLAQISNTNSTKEELRRYWSQSGSWRNNFAHRQWGFCCLVNNYCMYRVDDCEWNSRKSAYAWKSYAQKLMFLLVSPMASGNMKMGIITECIQQLIIKLLNVPAWSPGLFFKIRIRQKQCTHVELLFTFTMYIFWLSVKQIPITFFLNPHYQTPQEKNHGCARAERRSTRNCSFNASLGIPRI